jgi:hypothetical protein
VVASFGWTSIPSWKLDLGWFDGQIDVAVVADSADSAAAEETFLH